MARGSIFLSGLVALLVGCATPDGQAEPAEAVAPQERREPLPDLLDSQIAQYLDQYGRYWPTFRFHGVVLVARGDEVAVHRAFGMADLTADVPNETTTRFAVGTLSAQLVAAAIMKLADGERLSTSDTVDVHLPRFPGGDKITIRHLLTHTSGITNFTETREFQGSKSVPVSVARLVDGFARYALEHEPGAKVTPSNSNYVLLSAIIEKVTGDSFESYIAAEVLAPLEMTATEFGTTNQPQATGLQFNEQEHLDVVRDVHPAAFGAAGGYISRADDLFRFNRGLLTNALLSEASRDQMMGLADDVGYAWVTQDWQGRRLSGWPGLIDGLNCSVLTAIDDETVVIVMSNTEVVSAGRVAQDIMTMIYGGDAPKHPEAREVPEPLTKQASAVGHYVITRKTERMIEAVDPEQLDSLTEIDVVLQGESLALVIPSYGRKRMHPKGGDQWFFKDLPRTTARYMRQSDGSGRLYLTQPGGAELAFIQQPKRI